MISECFLCGSPKIWQAFRFVDKEANIEEEVAMCWACFNVCCRADDQHAAHVWKGLRESQSAGYTDGGFMQMLWRHFEANNGLVGIVFVPPPKTIVLPADQRDELIPYLVASIPVPGMLLETHVWCRSNGVMFQGLLTSAQKHSAIIFEVDHSWPWVEDRWFVAPKTTIPEELKPERNPAIATALVKQAQLATGATDLFQNVTDQGSPLGYELIRRWLL